jgi:hypothetical protein
VVRADELEDRIDFAHALGVGSESAGQRGQDQKAFHDAIVSGLRRQCR